MNNDSHWEDKTLTTMLWHNCYTKLSVHGGNHDVKYKMKIQFILLVLEM